MEPPRKRLKSCIDELENANQLFLNQLPEEVLLMIFRQLTNVNDLLSVKSTSRQFARILKASRVKWMFMEVLKISIDYEKDEEIFSWRDKWNHFNNLRLVCKSWYRSVNAIMENDPSHFYVDFNDPIVIKDQQLNAPRPVVFKIYKDVEKTEQARIDHFTNYFLKQKNRSSAYNPMPSRHLHIKFQRELPKPNWEQFSHHVSKYLQSFGVHVWYLTVGDSSVFEDNDLINVYSYLSEWVQLMPNIKSLVLDYYGGASANRLQPFPYLKNLTSCQFGRFCDSAYYVLKRNTHIRNLSLMTNSHLVLPKIMKIKFIHPLELTLSYVLTDELFFVRTIASKVHKFRLHCGGAVFFTKWFMKIFRLLKKSGVEILDLDLSEVFMFNKPFQEILDLPSLKDLYLKVSGNFDIDLDWFLGNLDSLESFTLEVSDINKIFVATGAENDDISDSEDETDESCNEGDSDQILSDQENNSDEELPDKIENEDASEKQESDSDEKNAISSPETEVTTTKSKREKYDYMEKFHQARLWRSLPNLQNVEIRTTYFGWKYQYYDLERSGMPTVTFEMVEL